MTEADVRQIYDMLQAIAGKLGTLEERSHTPSDCAIALLVADQEKRVKAMEMTGARSSGFLAGLSLAWKLAALAVCLLAGLSGGTMVAVAQKLLTP